MLPSFDFFLTKNEFAIISFSYLLWSFRHFELASVFLLFFLRMYQIVDLVTFKSFTLALMFLSGFLNLIIASLTCAKISMDLILRVRMKSYQS